jgi:hypothetical protein
MPDRIGLELLADRVRAVALDRRGRAARATADVAWDPAQPDAAIAELRARLGGARRIGIAVGLAFLDVQRVALPPVRGEARRRMIALDPARVFPLHEPVVVALADDAPPVRATGGEPAERGEPAFAVSREQVRRWIAAFERWAPVESVVSAPAALARALRAGGAPTDGEHRLPAAADEEGVVQVRGGRVTGVRRAPRWRTDGDAADVAPPADPSRVALGAALGVDDAPSAVQLLPDDLAHGVARRRAAAVTRAAALCGLAVGLTLAAADRQRERRAMALERALRAELPRAAAAESLQARLAAFDDATRAGAELAERRADPLAVLGALGERLPEGAAITALRMEGDAWTVEGTARDAAALVPRFAGDQRLAEVRALAPSTRFVERGTPTETFSIAFRATGAAR